MGNILKLRLSCLQSREGAECLSRVLHVHTENARRVADQPGACPEACPGEAGAEGQAYAVSQQLSESFLDGQPQEQNSQGTWVYGMWVGVCACVSVC